MLNNGKELYTFLDNLFEPHGLIMKKDTWYLITSECICFFSISKSSFGGHYEHVMGCFLKALDDDLGNFPKFNKSHLKYSLRQMTDKDLVKDAFDLENKKFENNEREQIIKDLIVNYVLPFLKDVSTKNGIIKAVNKYEDLSSFIKGKLSDYLRL